MMRRIIIIHVMMKNFDLSLCIYCDRGSLQYNLEYLCAEYSAKRNYDGHKICAKHCFK